MKRFVLAENSEKDPMWKSSDNLMAGLSLSRMNSFEKDDDANSVKIEFVVGETDNDVMAKEPGKIVKKLPIRSDGRIVKRSVSYHHGMT